MSAGPLASTKDIRAAVLALPCAARREIATAILWSLPRDEVIALHGQLSLMMQKDIIGLLPPEISIRILGYLSPDDLLKCKRVSQAWARLCDDQSIWRELCQTHDPPIVPAHTTWHDLTVHRQLFHLHAGARTNLSPDESFECNSDEDSEIEQPSMSSADPASPSPNPLNPLNPLNTPSITGESDFRRRVVWERPHGGLPTYQRAAPPAPSPTPVTVPDPANDPPIASHIPIPSALPKVNYKQLYLVRRILNRRMTDSRPVDLEGRRAGKRMSWRPRATILTSASSTAAGGLPGHVESIYSLHLFQHHMRIPLTTTDPDELVYTLRTWSTSTDVFGTPVSTSWPGNVSIGSKGNMGRSPPPQPSVPVVAGRDWLLTGSRDRTLRLWQLGCEHPRVVKVFSGGHTGSILCHFVIEIPIVEARDSPSQRNRSPKRMLGTPQRDSTPKHRLVAVSGASDGRICLWDVEHGDGTPERVIEAHQDSVLFVRGDDQHIVSCSKDRTIRLFDIHTMEELLVIQQPADSGHRGAINAVGLTKDFIVSASGDRSVRVWDIRDGRMLATIDAHVRGISSMSFEPTPSAQAGWTSDIPGAKLRGTVVTGSSDTSIRTFYVVEVPPGTELLNQLSFRDMLDLEHDLSLDSDMEDDSASPRPRLVIQAGVEYHATCSCAFPTQRQSPDGCVRCLNRGHTDLVRSLSIGEQVTLSASYDSTIKMWNRRTGRLIFDFAGCHVGRVFAITGDSVRVVSSGLDARIVIVDFSEGLDTAFV